MKKIILIILLSFSLISCKTNYITCFIGNEFVSKEIISNSETDFLFKRIESKSLLKIIEENMKNNNSDTNVVKLISKSSKIILSIGLFDLLKCVCLEEGKLIFNYKTSI